MSKEKKIQKFVEKAYKNPLTQASLVVIESVPGIGTGLAAGRKAAEQRHINILEQRKSAFFAELEKGRDISSEMLETDEFIHSVVFLYDVIIRTYNHEKIRRFARILLSAIEKDELASDKFEEYVKILDNLSLRELSILMTLHEYELKHPHIMLYKEYRNRDTIIQGEQYQENDLQRANRFWDDFVMKIEDKLNIKSAILVSMLTGLSRTGLYETFAGSFVGYEGGKGKTTTLFDDFSEWIRLENEKLDPDD